MPDVFEWRSSPPKDLLVQAVQRLAAGDLVVFPTDTCYVACASALSAEAVAKLAALTPAAAAFQLAVAGASHAQEWAPDLPLLACRLVRRLWPGPLTLLTALAAGAAPAAQLPAPVLDLLGPDRRLPLRAPAHEALLQILEAVADPLFIRPLRRADGGEITDAAEVAAAPPPGVSLIIADGVTYFAQPATAIEVVGDRWMIHSPGVVTEDDLRRCAGCRIVFVCTGNTCRSPLAEALCKKLLADRLGCAVEELPARGFLIQSAGLSAFPGFPASPEAVEVAREFGADLAAHRSQPLTGELLIQADHVFTMTAGHLDLLAPHGAAMLAPPRLLSCEGEDVTDPIGAEPEVYRECARQIQRHLQGRMSEFRP